VVNGGALTLTVGTVLAVVAVDGSAFVKADVVMLQRIDQYFHSAGNFTLGVGILHPEEKYAAGLVSHALRDHALNQVAQVDKTGGGGSHTGDNGAFSQLTAGEALLHLGGSFGHIGEQKLCQCLIIHKYIPLCHSILA